MWGLTLDTVTAVNAVLANGTITRATNENYPDLFWVKPILTLFTMLIVQIGSARFRQLFRNRYLNRGQNFPRTADWNDLSIQLGRSECYHRVSNHRDYPAICTGQRYSSSSWRRDQLVPRSSDRDYLNLLRGRLVFTN